MQGVARRTAVAAIIGLVGLVVASASPSAAVGAVGARPTSAPAAAAPAAASTPGAVQYGGGDLQALVPARVLDTRLGVGAPRLRVGAARTVALKVTGVGGVPTTGVGAVVLNVTGVAPTSATYLTVWPGGAARPTASSLNLVRGLTVPNLVVAKVGRDGIVNIYNSSGAIDLVADLTGWFPEASGLQSLVPARALDTRTGVGAPRARVAADRTITVQLAGRVGLPSTDVAAVVVNLTGVAPTRSTYVTAWPSGTSRPGTSTLNVDRGSVTPNLAVVKVGTDGRIALYNFSGAIDLLVDVVAWFPRSAAYTPSTPARILDTRKALGAPSALGPAQQVAVQVTGRGGVPASGVGAVVLNLTGISPTRSTYVTAWPAGVPLPTASSLNLVPGAVRANLVMLQVGTGGKVMLYNRSGTTHLAGDVVGWFPTGTDTSVSMVPAPGTTLHGSGDLLGWTGDADIGGTVTFAASSDLPAVGGHFAYQGGPAGGSGVSGVVTGITARPDGGAVATYGPANLQDLFTDLDIHSTGAALDAAGPGGAPAARTADAGSTGAEVADATTSAPEDGCENSGGGSVPLPTAAFTGLSGDADFSLRQGTARFVLHGSLEVKWGISVNAGVSCTVTLLDRHLMWIGWTELRWKLKANLTISGKLSAQTSVTMPVTIGFTRADGETTNLSSIDVNGTASDDASVSATATASLTGEVAPKLFGVLGVAIGIKPSITATWTPAHPLGCVELKAGVAITLSAVAGRWGVTWTWTAAEVSLLEKTLYTSPGCSSGHWVGTINVAHQATWGDSAHRESVDISGAYSDLVLQLDSGGRQSYEAGVSVGYEAELFYPCPDTLGLFHTTSWAFTGSSTDTEDGGGNSLSWYRGTAFELWNRDDGTWFMPYHVSFAGGSGQYHCPAYPGEPGLAGGSGLSYAPVGLWEPTLPLVDNDPSPTRLVGTTTLTEPPGGGLDFDAYSYTITYDLTFVPATP